MRYARHRMLAGLVAFVMLAAVRVPAGARTSFVLDGAHLFSPGAVSSLDATIGNFNARTGKEVVVVTVPSLDGQTPQAAAQQTFSQQQVNGVLIFMAKAERVQGIVPDRAAAAFFPPGAIESIRQAMRPYFRAGDFDGGIRTGVDLILAQYRSHEQALGGATQPVGAYAHRQASGGGLSLFWLVLILIAGFLIIRAVFRAMVGSRAMPPGYGGSPGGYGAGYGPGYGGYGGFGGGGGFFSGLLGGLGGAWLGNELFGRNAGYLGGANPGVGTGIDSAGQADAAGWQNDAGQADMGNASFGDFGGGGGGDFGGGGGGDSGGGGGW